MIGRFVHKDGKLSNRPVARFGNISQMPPKNQIGGKILIEVRSLGGFSGSPVFVYFKPNSTIESESVQRNQDTYMLPMLLGVNSAHTAHFAPVLGHDGNPKMGGGYIAGNSGLAVIEPFWALQELFSTTKAFKARDDLPDAGFDDDDDDKIRIHDFN